MFKENNTSGTFVVLNTKNSSYAVHNPKRAEKRFVPASTFKIVNSLIGLHIGSIKNIDEVLPYGGEAQPFKVWENDMSLRNAIKISNVPIFRN